MNAENYVSSATAKRLKWVGYPQDYRKSINGALVATKDGVVCVPSCWDAMKWLREEKQICVEIVLWAGVRPYLVSAYRLVFPTVDIIDDTEDYPTYEQACDAGIAAACEWLIENTDKTSKKRVKTSIPKNACFYIQLQNINFQQYATYN